LKSTIVTKARQGLLQHSYTIFRIKNGGRCRAKDAVNFVNAVLSRRSLDVGGRAAHAARSASPHIPGSDEAEPSSIFPLLHELPHHKKKWRALLRQRRRAAHAARFIPPRPGSDEAEPSSIFPLLQANHAMPNVPSLLDRAIALPG
jgi:hypothetical protein